MDNDKYIGRLLDGRYEILEVIGTGGMAVVYKALCHRLNRMVAVKILKDEFCQDEDFRRRFQAESQAVAMLSHPNIVSVYDVSSYDDADFIVMELIEGISLKQYMEKKGVLNWKETLHFAMQIAKALEHAHGRGIVHRDIKPHNVMVLKNGSVKVADFGIAQMTASGNTMTKEALGSVHYISPEQAKGGRVDNRSDLYSLGIVMYEMIAGRVPFDGDTPVAVAIQHINGEVVAPSYWNPNIPKGLEQIVMRAIARLPRDRYATATAMLYDMDEFRKDPLVIFPDPAPVEKEATQVLPKDMKQQAERAAAQQTVAERTAMAKDHSRRQDRREEPEDRNRVATIAIASCVVVGIIAIIIFLVLMGQMGSKKDKVEIPDLVGAEFDQLPDYTNIRIVIDDWKYSDDYAEGQIISQDPRAHERVDVGTEVRVVISRGPQNAEKMPYLVGKSQAAAEAALDDLDLDLDIKIIERKNELAPGLVYDMDPKEGRPLTKGQTVTLYVSIGNDTSTAKVPDVTGLDRDEAEQELNKAGFYNIKFVEQVSTEPEGTVFDQSIKYDGETLIEKSSEIVLYVAKPELRMIDVLGERKDIAQELLEDMGLKVKFEDVSSDSIPVGCVVETDPVSGRALVDGQTVTLYISTGPSTTAVVPDVTGLDRQTAQQRLNGAGFYNIKYEEQESTETEGTVLRQSVPGETEAEKTAEITLYVAKAAPEGPTVPEIPDVPGPGDEGEQTPDE